MWGLWQRLVAGVRVAGVEGVSDNGVAMQQIQQMQQTLQQRATGETCQVNGAVTLDQDTAEQLVRTMDAVVIGNLDGDDKKAAQALVGKIKEDLQKSGGTTAIPQDDYKTLVKDLQAAYDAIDMVTVVPAVPMA